MAVAKITLYGPAQAPYTEKVRRALRVKGLEFELREPESPEDYRRWNPKTGLLPVLEIDGEWIPDSTAILFRLDELFPDPPLLSPDALVAQQQRQLENWADESFLWYFRRWQRLAGEAQAADAQAAGGGLSASLGKRLRDLFAWLPRGGTWERPETALLRELGDRQDDLVRFLGDRPFFFSDRLSMADLAVYGMLYTMRNGVIPGGAERLASRPALVELMRRVERETGG